MKPCVLVGASGFRLEACRNDVNSRTHVRHPGEIRHPDCPLKCSFSNLTSMAIGPQLDATLLPRTLDSDSGKHRGKRIVWAGRASLRSLVYTLSAIRYNLMIKTFYLRLIAAGKVKKVAMTACMHKLLIILNVIIRDSTPWNPQINN
jgi:hypothetical protein